MHLWRLGRVALCGAVIAGGGAGRGVAQETGAARPTPLQLADKGDDHRPAFFSVAPDGARADVRNATAFRRRVSLTLIDVPLGDAVHAIARQAGLDLTYSTELIPTGARVSLRADDITVVAALTDVLVDAGLDVELTGTTRMALVRRWAAASAERRVQGGATIAGQVTDGALKAPLSQVTVRIDGTNSAAAANADGRYVLSGLAAGTYKVTARRVGYQPLTKEITLAGTERTTLDFALVAVPTRLDEVVTTAVGQQRRYEVGNDISTINADSIAPTAPITSLTDLISARAPGVTVLETSGMTGAGEAIRIRGLSSLVLQNDPILIVDGVRQDNSAGGDVTALGIGFGAGTHPTPTRLNDIDFNDIATIDILKGPSASTEYGTDAANGVIVLTTKHGTAGRPEWRVAAEQTESEIPATFPTGYYSWGHTTDGSSSPVNCPLFPVFGAPASTAGSCVVDSVTQENPLTDPATTLFGTGNRAKYDLSVGGGGGAVRYFVSGSLSNETGVIEMPTVFRELADTAQLGLPHTAFNANSEQQRSVRANTAITLGGTADLAATASYLSTFQETPSARQLYQGAFTAPALGGADHYYGYGSLAGSSAKNTPLSRLSEIGSQNTDRVTGGLTGNWRPAGWFVGHATVGLDHGSQTNEGIAYPLANPAYMPGVSFLAIADATTDLYSADLRGTATASLGRGVRAVTSAGLQMVDTRIVGQAAAVANITPTNLTLNGATTPQVTQAGTRQATLGGYGEEEVSVADRLFLTGALRIDAASGFGRAYSTAAYPKASVSWLAVNGGPMTLRVRGAFGESGVQPTNGAALQLFAPTVVPVGDAGALVSGTQLNWPGNPDLRPERSTEFEGGVDVAGWNDRVSVGVTGYSKTTHDALVNVNLGQSFAGLTYQENIGEVRNSGVEGTATVGLIQSRTIAWDVAVTASVNHNVLLTLAPGVTAQTIAGQTGVQYRQTVGYPLYGLWAPSVTYADGNGDGIIEPIEVTEGDTDDYVAPSLPTREISVSTHIGLWRTVTIGALVDSRGGYRIANDVALYADYVGKSRQTNDPAAPLWLQARAVADGTFSPNTLIVEDGSFVRVREVSVTYAVPRSLTRALRVQSVSLTGAVRNLALWTRYTGVDPEVTNTGGINVQAAPTTGGTMLNNDVREDFGAVPLARYWVVRLNVGL